MRPEPGVKGASCALFHHPGPRRSPAAPGRPGFLFARDIRNFLLQSVATCAAFRRRRFEEAWVWPSVLCSTPFVRLPDYKRLVEATAGQQPLIIGLSGSQKSLYVAALGGRPARAGGISLATWSSRTSLSSGKVASRPFDPALHERVLVFPAPETHPHEEALPGSGRQQERHGGPHEPDRRRSGGRGRTGPSRGDEAVPPEVFAPYQLEIAAGQRLDLDQWPAAPQAMGYERVSKVETPGEFSVRGRFDVFPLPKNSLCGSTSSTTNRLHPPGSTRLRSGQGIRSSERSSARPGSFWLRPGLRPKGPWKRSWRRHPPCGPA